MNFIAYQIKKLVSGAKDHGKNYIKARPLLVHHLLRNLLFSILIQRVESCDTAVKPIRPGGGGGGV